jgi:hypothetical protein
LYSEELLSFWPSTQPEHPPRAKNLATPFRGQPEQAAPAPTELQTLKAAAEQTLVPALVQELGSDLDEPSRLRRQVQLLCS